MKKLMNKNALMAGAFALAVALALVFTLNQSPSVMAQTATPTATATATPAQVDYDEDDDRLIDISTFDQLNAMRYDTDGDGFVDIDYPEGDVAHTNYAAAFLNSASNKGCPASSAPDDGSPTPPRCRGYELTADIDIPDRHSWVPIPKWTTTFSGRYDGPYSRSISGMTTTTDGAGGLFGNIGSGGSVSHLILEDASVTLAMPVAPSTGADRVPVGVLVAQNEGTIREVQVEGVLTFTGVETNKPAAFVGGLVGRNRGTIDLSWADVDVSIIGSGARGGGFVGDNDFRSSITASFSSGDVAITIPDSYASHGKNRVGGFSGVNKGLISYSVTVGEVSPRNHPGTQPFGPICWGGGRFHHVAPGPGGCSK